MKVLFENPKIALGFCGVLVLGAVLVVGTEDTPGALTATVESLDERPERRLDAPIHRANNTAQDTAKQFEEFEQADEFDDADDWGQPIDSASAEGIDPTPTDQANGFAIAGSGSESKQGRRDARARAEVEIKDYQPNAPRRDRPDPEDDGRYIEGQR